jgi:uncharacterized protein YjeT (DUF2065 family)
MPRRKNSAHHKNLFGAICMVTGVVLLMCGRRLAYSMSGQLRYLFTGSPTSDAAALMVGGGALIVVGVYLVFLQPD